MFRQDFKDRTQPNPMAYVPGYNYDIFISFTHQDNDRLPGLEHGWVDEFHQQLENQLKRRRQLDGLRIWRDRELHGNTDFDIAIENKIDSVALFLVLHSRAQRKSDYCRKELDWFTTKYRDSMLVGEQRRVFNVLLDNFPHQQWAEPLQGVVGFPRHDAEGDEMGEFTHPNEITFGKQLRRVVDAAETILDAMRVQRQAARPEPSASTPAATGAGAPTRAVIGEASLPTVFLATVAEGQELTRERLLNEIGDRARLLDTPPPPHPHGEHRQQVEAALQQADLSIHLLDDDPGDRIVDLKQTTYPREQTEIALQQPLRQIIWLPPDLSIDAVRNDDYRELVRQLDSGERSKDGIELLRCDRNELIEQVLTRIAAAGQPTAVADEASFLIDTHQKDQRYAYQLAGLLAERGADVDFNKESQDPVQSLALFEEAVRQARTLVILFGQVNAPWLSSRLKTAVKVMAEQFMADQQQLERLCVLLLPGSQGMPAELRLPPTINLTALDNRGSDAIDTQQLDSLLIAGPAGPAGVTGPERQS